MSKDNNNQQPQRIRNVDKYFQRKDNKLIFIGKSLEVNVPKHYKQFGYYTRTNVVKVLGILQLVIDKKYEAILSITTMIETIPNSIDETEDYIVLKYSNGDIFLNKDYVINNPEELYYLFMRFVTHGKLPEFLRYEDLDKIFDHCEEINGTDLGVGRELKELVFAYLCRDAKDLSKQYRLTSMKDNYKLVGILNIFYAPQSTTSKLLGNYLDNGITAAVLTEEPVTDTFEQILLTDTPRKQQGGM